MPILQGTVGYNGSNKRDDVILVQRLLNRFIKSGQLLLKDDGSCGRLTIFEIERFQKDVVKMHVPDKLISPDGPTFQALCGGDTNKVLIAWGGKVSKKFKDKVIDICQELKLNPDYLMSAMAFESGETFSPKIKNAAGSGAVGLIQFMPSTAEALGTTTDELAGMTAEDQLEYVKDYFTPSKGRLNSLEDLYMAILWPKAIGQSPDTAIFLKGKKTFTQNKGLDLNKDGKITIAEAATLVRAKYSRGLQAFIG